MRQLLLSFISILIGVHCDAAPSENADTVVETPQSTSRTAFTSPASGASFDASNLSAYMAQPQTTKKTAATTSPKKQTLLSLASSILPQQPTLATRLFPTNTFERSGRQVTLFNASPDCTCDFCVTNYPRLQQLEQLEALDLALPSDTKIPAPTPEDQRRLYQYGLDRYVEAKPGRPDINNNLKTTPIKYTEQLAQKYTEQLTQKRKEAVRQKLSRGALAARESFKKRGASTESHLIDIKKRQRDEESAPQTLDYLTDEHLNTLLDRGRFEDYAQRAEKSHSPASSPNIDSRLFNSYEDAERHIHRVGQLVSPTHSIETTSTRQRSPATSKPSRSDFVDVSEFNGTHQIPDTMTAEEISKLFSQ